MNPASKPLRRIAMVLLLSAMATGCSSTNDSGSGWFGGGKSKNASVVNDKQTTVKTETVTPVSANPPATATVAQTPITSPTSGFLQVNTSPSLAKVYLDGVYRGRSPLRLEAEPGEYSIAVKLEGYRMITGKVSVRKGDTAQVEMTLDQ